jgi:hypothetical protein
VKCSHMLYVKEPNKIGLPIQTPSIVTYIHDNFKWLDSSASEYVPVA